MSRTTLSFTVQVEYRHENPLAPDEIEALQSAVEAGLEQARQDSLLDDKGLAIEACWVSVEALDDPG
jgi:hypothetical protein